MSEERENRLARNRIILITLSSFLVTIPQLLWTVFGYRGVFLITADIVLVLLGFVLLLAGLIDDNRLLRLGQGWKVAAKSGEKKFSWWNPKEYLSLLMLAYFAIPYLISGIMGYPEPSLPVEASMIAVSAAAILVLIYFHGIEQGGRKIGQAYYFVVLLVLSITWTSAFWYGSPRFPTDEMTLDYFSSHLFISGINPYIPANTANVFSYYSYGTGGFPLNVITPFTTGGYVTNLSYPAFAFYSFVPASLLGVSATMTMIPVYAAPVLIVYWAYRKEGMHSLAILPPFLLLLNPSYLVQVSLGYPDIVWVSFMLASVFLFRKPWASGILMGLSISVKQIPWIAIPFFLYFIFRETGGKAAIRWVAGALAIFLAVNSYFLIVSPVQFLQSILAPELQNLLGIGFGPSQLAFLDILPISHTFFSLMTVSVIAASLLAYVTYYRRLRYAFLAFPLIIFMFNYRLLLSYLMFWPIMALVVPLFMDRNRPPRPSPGGKRIARYSRQISRVIMPVLIIAVLVVPVAYQISSPVDNSGLSINDLSVYGIHGSNITGLSVVVHMDPGNVSYNDLLFRIMPSTASTNMNGYLWESANISSAGNGSDLIHLKPVNSYQEIYWSGNYRLIAYYANISSAFVFSMDQGKIS